MAKSLSIVGAGRVGRALARRLHELGWQITAVSASTEVNARKAVRFIGAGKPYAGVTPQVFASQTILVTVPDDAIASVADELAQVGGEALRGKTVLHTSGALDATVLSSVKTCGAATGSMHPLQSFSGVNVPPLEGKVFGIEGDEPAIRVARRIVRALGGIPVVIAASKKPLYHAAGSFAAGHMLALEETGTQILMAAGMKRDESVRALLSLTRQVLDHYEKLGPTKAWTGPLSRGDYGVVAAHEEALLKLQPEFLRAYQAVCRLTAQVLASDPEGMMRELQTISENLQTATKSKGEHA